MDKDWPIYALMLLSWIVVIAMQLRSLRFLKDKTMEDYVAKNPESFKNGQIKCLYCGGTQLSLMRETGIMGHFHRHLCSQCGKELYRSKLR